MSLKLPNNRYEEIKKTVVNLFLKYDVKCVPVNGFELAIKMGIKILPYSSISEDKQHLLLKRSSDGFFVENSEGKFYIFYNDSNNFRRINNTIFHEIGHIVLDHSEESELAEAEVNFFAKYALVPPALVHKLKVQSPEDIFQRFDVSYQAALYAYNYYQKWLRYGASTFTTYEIQLLDLFKDAV